METHEFDKCEKCGRSTTTGQRQWAEWYRDHPIYGINLNRPFAEIIDELRHELVVTRGKIGDAGRANMGFKESLEDVEGALTCALVALYNIKERSLGNR